MTHGSLFSGIIDMENRKFICQQCGKEFSSYNKNPKFCSIECKSISQTIPIDFEEARMLYEKGMTQEEVAISLGTTQKVICNVFKRNHYKCRVAKKRNQYGSNNSSWVGSRAKYATLHKRVESLKGRPKYCEICGTHDPLIRYEWANVSGDYYDIENGYKRMCIKCHRKFDHSEHGVRNYVKR